MIVKIDSDQPRITVWSFSSTIERPRRSSDSLESMPLAMTPIRALTMKSPPTVSSEQREQEPPARRRRLRCAGVEGVQEAVVELAEEALVGGLLAQLEQRDDHREEQDQQAAWRAVSHAMRAGRARRHGVVEHVAQPVAEPGLAGWWLAHGRRPRSGSSPSPCAPAAVDPCARHSHSCCLRGPEPSDPDGAPYSVTGTIGPCSAGPRRTPVGGPDGDGRSRSRPRAWCSSASPPGCRASPTAGTSRRSTCRCCCS